MHNIIFDYTDPRIETSQHPVYGLGFDASVDWLTLTREERIVKDAGPYKKVGYAWQFLLDYSLLYYPRVYHQIARGHDKTERETWWMLLWMLTAPYGQGYCCGSDRENAQLYKIAAEWIVNTHSHIFSDIRVYNYNIEHKKNGAHIRILASDEATNYGLTPDLLLVTDFHSWSNEGFWNALWTSMGKRPNSRMWIESNALALGTEQVQWIRPIREAAKKFHEEQKGRKPGPALTDKRWFFWAPEGFFAPWQRTAIYEWSETLLPPAFNRLILNKDTSEGQAYLTEEQVRACEYPIINPDPPPDANTVITTDLGLTTDAAVVAAISEYVRENRQFIQLNRMTVFTGSRDEPINIDKVVNEANTFSRMFNAKKYCDPWEMRHIMQQDPTWQEYPLSPSNIKNITQRLWRTVVQKRLIIWKDCAAAMQKKGSSKKSLWNLMRELTEAVLVETSYGMRVDHKSQGFTDRLMALGMGVDILYQDSFPSEKKPEEQHYKHFEENTWGQIYDKINPAVGQSNII